jgi:TatA/E family protein of Tat protein translocase
MGHLGMQEMIVIFVIALLVFGPRKLPELGKSLGKGLREFRRATNEMKATWDEQVREAESEVRDATRDIRKMEQDIRKDLSEEPRKEPPSPGGKPPEPPTGTVAQGTIQPPAAEGENPPPGSS